MPAQTQGQGNGNAINDPIADAVARALSSGTNAFQALQQQHLDGAAQAGASIVAAGLAHTRNAAMAPIGLDPTSIIATLTGNQPQAAATTTTATQPTQPQAAPATTQVDQTTVQAQPARFWKNPAWAIGAAIAAVVVALIAMNTFLGDESKGHSNFAHKAGFWWLIAIAAGVGAFLIVWSRTNPKLRPERTRVVRHTYELNQQQAAAPAPVQQQPAQATVPVQLPPPAHP